MRKPEKRILAKDSVYLQYDKGYNHCYDEFEGFLPNEDEIYEYLEDTEGSFEEGCNANRILAKAIAERIGK